MVIYVVMLFIFFFGRGVEAFGGGRMRFLQVAIASLNRSAGYQVKAVILKIICHFQDWMSYFKSHGIHQDDIEKVVIGKRRGYKT
jgi:hypothetical protein